MEKTQYDTFFNEIKNELIEFLFNYKIPFNCKFPQNENDDIQYTIQLGDKFGNVNILFESFNNLPYNERKSDTFTICIKFWNYQDNEKLFIFDSGQINDKDGTFILFSNENGLEGLKNDFREILKIWSKEQKEKLFDRPTPICLN